MSKYDTDITIVLDRSGSMATILNDTIGGFNSFLAEQQALGEGAKLSLVQFDNTHESVFTATPIQEVQPLTDKTFVPRGSTALLDAMGSTINATGTRLAALAPEDRPQNVVFVVITDGEENASREYSRSQVFESVQHQTDKYNWTFLYLGANQDAIAVGQSLGVRGVNSISYNASSAGTGNTYSAASVAVKTVRTNGSFRGFSDSTRKSTMQ